MTASIGHSWLRRRRVGGGGGARSSPPRMGMGIRYVLSVVVVAVYAAFMVRKYGLSDGLMATYLTWSFFVLGTPVADAGGILDVPLRLLTGVPMLAIETCVVAFTIVSMALIVRYRREAFDRTPLLRAFRTMLTTPYPYWGVIALCILGTFMSVRLGDIVIDNIGEALATGTWAALTALPAEFWVVCVAYAAVVWLYVAGMLPLLRPLLESNSVYGVLF